MIAWGAVLFRRRPTKNTDQPGNLLGRPGFLLPAIEALVIQVIVLLVLYAFLFLLGLFGRQVTIGVAVLLQGTFAMLLSRWRRMPIWWLAIQFLFPPALLVGHALDLSPSLFFGAFLLLFLVYWTPFKTRVPLYLSGQAARQKVLELVPVGDAIRFIDIGSGLGGLAIYLAKNRPLANVSGIELAPVPWFIGWLRGRISHSRARLLAGDYTKLDFSQFDIVFAYLSPAAMEALWEKALAEMRPGALLISYEFIIPEIKPDIVIGEEMDGALLYVWRMPNISTK